jgi:TPR repeat protein
MNLTRFQADKRLWVGSSVILFFVSLWVPRAPPFFEYDPSCIGPVRLLQSMLEYNRDLKSLPVIFDERPCSWRDYLRCTFFLWPSAVFSVLFGWLLQCIVVMLRTKRSTERAQSTAILTLILLLNLPSSGSSQVFTKRTNDIPGLKAAAERGDPVAQHDLAGCYLLGLDMAKDPAQAVAWFTKAAKQGHVDSQYRLGLSFATGEGIQTNQVEALHWFRKAAEQDHIEAQYSLGYCYAMGQGVEANGQEALKWLTKAAKAGNVKSQTLLAKLYVHGSLIQRNEKEAVKWLLRGAALGHPEALYNLGICYAVGVGVRKDIIQAYKYMYAAKARGYDANEALSQLEKEMTPEGIAEAKRLAEPYIPKN